MTLQEFSDEFDVLYNNIMSNQAPGLDEYEKSVFLTKAQYEIIKNYFNPKSNPKQEGFDDSPKRQIDFSKLMAVNEPTASTSTSYAKFSDSSTLYTIPTDILFVLNEKAIITENSIPRIINIVPISFIEYSRILSKSYKQPLKNQGWRLFNVAKTTEVGIDKYSSISEIIVKSDATLSDYKIRYVRRPKPIILTTLEGVTLGDEAGPLDCELDEILHPEILQRAVELAKVAYLGDAKSSVEIGVRSE